MSAETCENEVNWGQELKNFRRRARLMQDGAAELLGVSQAYISRLESGSAEPSQRLKNRLRQLMFQPEHRSMIDHVRAMVQNSPHIAGLYSQREGHIWVEASSKPLDSYRDIFTSESYDGPLEFSEPSEMESVINLVVGEGAFDGRLAFAESVWTKAPTKHRPEKTHWKTFHSPIRDDNGNWLVHAHHVQMSEEEKRAYVEQWGGLYHVRPFDNKTAASA